MPVSLSLDATEELKLLKTMGWSEEVEGENWQLTDAERATAKKEIEVRGRRVFSIHDFQEKFLFPAKNILPGTMVSP